jgi:hypothetical protein
MTEPLLSAAMKEAYASVPEDEMVLHTLELWHPGFLDEADVPTPIRVVLDDKDWSLTLEDTAPRDGGDAVSFKGLAFSLVPPGTSESGPTSARLALDSVTGELRKHLEAARDDPQAIEVIYRAWLLTAQFDDDVLTGWEPDPEPGEIFEGLVLRNVRLTATRAEGDCTFDAAQYRGFPRAVYDRTQYPAL